MATKNELQDPRFRGDVMLASDHAGFALKNALKETLAQMGYVPQDLGTNSEASVDYPDFAKKLCEQIQGDAMGILICGSGTGMSIAANRFKHIRAALCRSGLEAKLARLHNNANVLCLGGRITGVEVAKDCVEQFLKTPFEGGRHEQRVKKL